MALFRGSWVEKEGAVRWFSKKKKKKKNWREWKMVCRWKRQVRELYKRFLGMKISGQCSEPMQKLLPVQRLQTHRLSFFFFLLKTLTELWLTLRVRLHCTEKVSRCMSACVGPVYFSRTRKDSTHIDFFFLAENFDGALANIVCTFRLHWKGK